MRIRLLYNGSGSSSWNGRVPESFGRGRRYRDPQQRDWPLLHPVKILLQNLPVLQVLEFLANAHVDLLFIRVLRGAIDLVEDAEVTREGGVRQFVRGHFVGHVMIRGHLIEDTALAG